MKSELSVKSSTEGHCYYNTHHFCLGLWDSVSLFACGSYISNRKSDDPELGRPAR